MIEVKLGDLRRRLHFIVLAHASNRISLHFENAWHTVRNTIETLQAKAHMLFGHTLSNGKWILTAASKATPHVLDALDMIAEPLNFTIHRITHLQQVLPHMEVHSSAFFEHL